jgi:hypothetical protein
MQKLKKVVFVSEDVEFCFKMSNSVKEVWDPNNPNYNSCGNLPPTYI